MRAGRCGVQLARTEALLSEAEGDLAHELKQAAHAIAVHLHVELWGRHEKLHTPRASRVGDGPLDGLRHVGVEHIPEGAAVWRRVEPQVVWKRPVVGRAW